MLDDFRFIDQNGIINRVRSIERWRRLIPWKDPRFEFSLQIKAPESISIRERIRDRSAESNLLVQIWRKIIERRIRFQSIALRSEDRKIESG